MDDASAPPAPDASAPPAPDAAGADPLAGMDPAMMEKMMAAMGQGKDGEGGGGGLDMASLQAMMGGMGGMGGGGGGAEADLRRQSQANQQAHAAKYSRRADVKRRRVAAPPRPRRGHAVEAGSGAAAVDIPTNGFEWFRGVGLPTASSRRTERNARTPRAA